jgi:hypothetical protein
MIGRRRLERPCLAGSGRSAAEWGRAENLVTSNPLGTRPAL